MPLSNFFYPKSIAIIGASRDEKKIGYGILKNLISAGFKGSLYPVNPNAEKILDHKCYNSINSLPKNINLAIFAIPAQFILESIRECSQKGCKNAVIISAGFRERGSNGLKLEKELIEEAKKYDFKILGPNCLGFLSSHNNINASFAKDMIDDGDIAFISQSGAICSAALSWAKSEKIGFSKFISLGNMAVLNETHFLNYLENDSETKAVFAYLENFSDGENFILAAKKLAEKKPLIILKSGITEKGKSMAMSHTGAMAEDKNITDGIIKQINAIKCGSLGEMFNLIKLIANIHFPCGDSLAVIGNAGGINVLNADKISETSLVLASYNNTVIQKLQKKLPLIASINNPLDIIGDADAKRYFDSINAIIAGNNINNLLVTLTPQTVTEPLKTAKSIIKLKEKYKKNIIANFMGGDDISDAVNYLKENKISNFLYPEDAIRAFNKISLWEKKKNNDSLKNQKEFLVKESSEEEIKKIIGSKKGLLDYNEARNIFDILEIQTVRSLLSSDLKELNSFAQKIGYPIVMKAMSDAIMHKTEVGAVKLGICDAQEMVKSYEQLIKIGGKYKTRVLIQPMITGAIELIVGAKRDQKFGPILLFGLGGIYTEILKDISLRVGNITEKDAMEMISDLKTSAIFEGARGRLTDKTIIANLILKISYLVNNFPQIREIDLNPVMIKDGKIYAVDIRIIVN
ncbi:MAG: acetate--CoA ligase family protein [bacterium]